MENAVLCQEGRYGSTHVLIYMLYIHGKNILFYIKHTDQLLVRASLSETSIHDHRTRGKRVIHPQNTTPQRQPALTPEIPVQVILIRM